jgi:hypothetical protein
MGAGKHRRAAWATGVSLVLHVLVLTGMVIGLKVARPPPENQPIDVQLIPPPELQPRPQPARRAPERSTTSATPLRPHLTPQPPPEVPVLALPGTPAPAPAPAFGSGSKGLLPSLSGRLGCDDAQAVHLTREQHQACVSNLARLAQEAKPLNIYIPEGKQIDYDRYVHCQTVYKHAGMPSSGSHDPSTPGSIAGLGYVPSFAECPPGDR